MGPKGKLIDRSSATRRAGRNALLLGFAVFGLLSILNILTFRKIYVLNEDDIAVLADSLLLAPDARWQNWFTQGYLHFFDLYPDWPAHGLEVTRTAFTRPAFQFIIYLAHFVLGRDWASYQLINCFAVAGMGAVAFQIAQTVLGLRTGPSLVAAVLVVLSPPTFGSWLFGVGFANEPLATIFVAGAFLAVLARRDVALSCVALSGATDQRDHCVGAFRGGHNHYVAPQAGRVASSSGVYRCGYALTGGNMAGPSIRFLWRHWRHLCNGLVYATFRFSFPKAHFL